MKIDIINIDVVKSQGAFSDVVSRVKFNVVITLPATEEAIENYNKRKLLEEENLQEIQNLFPDYVPVWDSDREPKESTYIFSDLVELPAPEGDIFVAIENVDKDLVKTWLDSLVDYDTYMEKVNELNAPPVPPVINEYKKSFV